MSEVERARGIISQWCGEAPPFVGHLSVGSKALEELVLAALASLIPAGWKLVPIEPTQAMLEAVKPRPAHWNLDGPDGRAMRAAIIVDRMSVASDYRDLLAAAPSPGDDA